RLSFEGRRYTKGLYWNITHSKKFKKNTTDKQQAQVHELVKPINQQASCQKLLLRIQTIENTPISNIKIQEPLNVKQRYIRKAPSYVKANTHSKAHKKLKSESKLKSVLSDGIGLQIFKIVILCILNFCIGIFGIALFSLAFEGYYGSGGPGFIAVSIPFLGLFAYLCYNIIKRIKNLKTTTPTEKQAKNKDFISGYSVMEFFSIVSAFSFLMPIIINYINYINWYKTLPAYLIFKPLITPSKGIEPLLIVFLGLALLAAWLGTSKYKFSDPKHQKLQRIKTFIISGLLFLTGLLYLLIGLANVLNFVGLPFYAPVQHPEGSAYLIVCGLISIVTALMPSKLLFGKNLITELKSKFK
ncbi:MAG: hypothetical protein ACO27N_08270, partial [Bacteroidia bacterium]